MTLSWHFCHYKMLSASPEILSSAVLSFRRFLLLLYATLFSEPSPCPSLLFAHHIPGPQTQRPISKPYTPHCLSECHFPHLTVHPKLPPLQPHQCMNLPPSIPASSYPTKSFWMELPSMSRDPDSRAPPAPLPGVHNSSTSATIISDCPYRPGATKPRLQLMAAAS